MAVRRDLDNLEPTHLHKMVDLRDKAVLEIGCGEGRLTKRYHQVVQHVVGIDLELDALQTAKNALVNKSNFAFADAIQLPFQSGSFDVVIYAWSL